MQTVPLPRLLQRMTLALALMACCGLVQAQQPVESGVAQAGYSPRSGDAWTDRQLADINRYAARYPRSFADEVSRYYSVPLEYVEAMMQQPSWTAGDLFLACAVAQALGQPCRTAVREWSRDHEQGWKGVIQRLQPKPDPALMRRLRKDIEQSYLRWARPLAG